MKTDMLLLNKVVIRIGTHKDLPLIDSFIDGYDEEPLDVEINKPVIKNAARDMITQNCVLMGELNGETIGVIAGYVTTCLFSKETMFASMFFFVVPYHRRRTKEFLREIELCLIPTEVNRLIIGVPAFKDYNAQKRFMRMMGYKPLEEHYYKRI